MIPDIMTISSNIQLKELHKDWYLQNFLYVQLKYFIDFYIDSQLF